MMGQFKIKNQQQIQMIRNLGIEFLYVYPEKSDTAILPPNTPPPKPLEESEASALSQEEKRLWKEKQQNIKKQKEFRRKARRCEKQFEYSMNQLRSVARKINTSPLDAINEAEQLVDKMVEMLLTDEGVSLRLMSEGKENNDIYYHSINVAVLSMMLAKANDMPREHINIIALGALFHDMGKIKLPTSITRKTTPLTAPEENYFRLHTQYSMELAERAKNFPEEAKPILAQHHECLDGSGYPLKLQGDAIDLYAQLVGLVNAYDEHCHAQNPKKKLMPSSALSYMYKNQSKKYNKDYLVLLIRIMGVYPPGSIVLLSNKQIGLVTSVNTKRLLFPEVLIYDESFSPDEAPILDLEDSNLKIIRAIPPEKLPEKIHSYLNPRSRITYFIDKNR